MSTFTFDKPRVKLVFGLTCNIERTDKTPSGFQAMDVHAQSGEQLFGQPRLAGFAGMLKTGYTENIMFLGAAETGQGETFQQGDAIAAIIKQDYGALAGRCSNADAGYGTNEAAQYIRRISQEEGVDLSDVVVSTSHYHLPRAMFLLQEQGLLVASVAAEIFYLLDHTDEDGNMEMGIVPGLIETFGGGGYAQRTVNELIGTAKKAGGFWKPQGTKITA